MLTPVSPAPSLRARGALPRPGSVLLGRYRLDSERGRTGAGTLHDAFETATGRRVSVEIASSLDDARARVRFARDAMLAQRLEGEHVLRVLDTGTLPDGTPFVVRDVALTSLAREVEARGPAAPEQAVAWTLDAAEAVAEAHALGIAHGDLCPEAVLLARGEDGELGVRVAWTTAAKARRDAKEDVGRDVEGLGVLLRALVTGSPSPRPGETDDDGAKTLPNGIAHVVARATAESGSRYANLGELVADLAPLAPRGHAAARNIAFMLSRAGLGARSMANAAAGARHLPVEATPLAPPPPLPPKPIATIGRPGETPGIPKKVLALDDDDPDETPVPTDHPVQPVPWIADPHSRAALLQDHAWHDGAWHEPRSHRGLVFAIVAGLLVVGTLLGTLTLSRTGMLPHWTGTGPALDEVEPAVVSGAETRALAARAGLDAVWSWARALPATGGAAEREAGPVPGDASPGGSDRSGSDDAERSMEHEVAPSPAEIPGAVGPSGTRETSPLGVPRSAAEAEQRTKSRGAGRQGPEGPDVPNGARPTMPSPASPTAPAETREPLDLGPPGFPDRGTDI